MGTVCIFHTVDQRMCSRSMTVFMCLVASHLPVRSPSPAPLLRVYNDTKVQSTYGDCFLPPVQTASAPMEGGGQVVISTACLTLSLWLFVFAPSPLPPLGWSHSSLCPPRDQCAYHRPTKRLTVEAIEWSSNVIGLFPYFDLSRDVDWINAVAFSSRLVCVLWNVHVHTHAHQAYLSLCVCVNRKWASQYCHH